MKRIFTIFILVAAFCLTACQNAPRSATPSSIPNNLGNPDDIDPITQPNTTGAPDVTDAPSPTPIGYQIITYASAADIPEGNYAIAHTQSDGTVIYSAPYQAHGGYTTYNSRGEALVYECCFEMPREGAYTADPQRFIWAISTYDETMIPTMYAGDKIIYHSKDYIPTSFTIERFADQGYTIGIANLFSSISGNIMYSSMYSIVEPNSDTINLENLGATDIYLVSVGGVPMNEATISETGTVLGLEKNKNYACDVRTGTEQIMAAFRADSHLWTSFEQWMSGKFTFIDEISIEVAFDNNLPTGYYSINGSGLFRYISETDKEKESELTFDDYNVAFFALDENGYIISTINGYMLDENGYITQELIDDAEQHLGR